MEQVSLPYFAQHSPTVLERLYNGKSGLYPHQREALLKLFQMGIEGNLAPQKRMHDSGAAFFLIGVGCGKTVILQSAPYVLGRFMKGRQALFLSHNCTLRQRVMEDFPKNGAKPVLPEWPLYKYGILEKTVRPPKILEVSAEDYANVSFCLEDVDILVSNWQFLKNLVGRGDINPDDVGLIVVDEAHHSAASSYRTIFNYFRNAILVFLTGTRHRGDKEQLPYVPYQVDEFEELNGRISLKKAPRVNFEFTIQDAWKLPDPVIKRITYLPAKSEGFKIEEDGEEIEYTAEEFFNKAEKDRTWFHNCILADSFCEPVLNEAVRLLEIKRASGKPHKMIIRALNIKHAHRLRILCEKYPLLTGKVGLVHSENEEYDQEGRPSEVFRKFATDQLIALIHVSMVGEGFNVPFASISVPLCVMRSTQKAEQEFGRIIRKVEGSYPDRYDFADFKSDNMAIVVTHQSLGIEELFDQFMRGDEYIDIEDLDDELPESRSRVVIDDYISGDSILRLSSTGNLSAGDEITVNSVSESGQEQELVFVVDDILGKSDVRVNPLMVDIPKGSSARKSTRKDEEDACKFIGHLGLRWFLKINGKEVEIEDYRKQKALQNLNLSEDSDGQIISSEGKRLSEYPPEIEQAMIERISSESKDVDIPFSSVEASCFPGEAKKERQEYHLKRIKRAIYDLERLTVDGRKGKNLVEDPLESLKEYTEKPDYSKRPAKNNQELLHRGILGCLKIYTGKSWKEHITEEDFNTAVEIVLKKVGEVREELNQRRRSIR
ncbi:DEAD/DEAH box helicase [Vacuolonema iberomarrocanum]|uniref:DEAD/DEAH box helicase n=1 Tax=Vacuolonema iberomarrocanum TaxID=3454632 RepID=UPI0019F571BB|nr:DEAD/DEAH box helicase family protein [filamentous cyanobacterium LEGE 07170]